MTKKSRIMRLEGNVLLKMQTAGTRIRAFAFMRPARNEIEMVWDFQVLNRGDACSYIHLISSY